MKVAFYAPMKSPEHAMPSGDRLIARLLLRALRDAGHEVDVASTFRSRDAHGDAVRQARLRAIGERLAERLLRRYERRPRGERPRCWFTYHLYHKAPDWLGPRVAAALDIPYVVTEASFAPKRAGGEWAIGHEAVRRAIGAADAILCLNSDDVECLRPLVADAARLVTLRPFLDLAPFAAPGERAARRRAAAHRHGLPPAEPWLLTVAMMRPGNKRESYLLLARALERIVHHAWRLVVVGDGPVRAEVEAAFAGLGEGRVIFTGVLDAAAVRALLEACDLFVWPALREPIGMSLLEAHAAGLPVVAGGGRGVVDVVRDGLTGRLVPLGDAAAFAAAVSSLLDDPERRARLGRNARETVFREHGLAPATARVDRVLSGLMERCRP